MKTAKDVITKNGLLKWLTKIILVLGLITFSGHISEFRVNNAGPTKTELNEVRKVRSKRTANFKKIFAGLKFSALHSTNRTETVTSFLLYQENRITVRLKSNVEDLSTNKQTGFLIFYSTDTSEEFYTIPLKG